MSDQSYSTVFSVEQSPQEVFAAITKVSDWWSGEIVGGNLRRLIATGKPQPSPW